MTLFRFLGKQWKCGTFTLLKKTGFSLPSLIVRQLLAAMCVFDAEKDTEVLGKCSPMSSLHSLFHQGRFLAMGISVEELIGQIPTRYHECMSD